MRKLGLLIAAIGVAVLIWAMWSKDEPLAPQNSIPGGKGTSIPGAGEPKK